MQRENADSLPPGWLKIESRSHPGKFYYVNEKTKQTTWTFPAAVETVTAQFGAGMLGFALKEVEGQFTAEVDSFQSVRTCNNFQL